MNRNMFMALREDSVILRDAFCLLEVFDAPKPTPFEPSEKKLAKLKAEHGVDSGGLFQKNKQRVERLKKIQAKVETPSGKREHLADKSVPGGLVSRKPGVFPQHLKDEIKAGGYTNLYHGVSNIGQHGKNIAEELGRQAGSATPAHLAAASIPVIAAGIGGSIYGAHGAKSAFRSIAKKELGGGVKKGILNHPVSKHLGKYANYYVPALGAAAVYGMTRDNN